MKTLAQFMLLVLSFVIASCSKQSDMQEVSAPITFNGFSEELKATEVLATLDSPISKGKNAIWCASFQSAWKALEKDLVGDTISLEGSPSIATFLNNAPDPRPYVPQDSLYVGIGWKSNGIIEKIHKDVRQKFPRKNPPEFPGIADDSFVAYSYLEGNVKFPRPYVQNHEGWSFREGGGGEVNLHSFGILPINGGELHELRRQPKILFSRKREVEEENFEFAIDLDGESSPHQIVVAKIAPESTLAAALEKVKKEISRMNYQAKTNGIDLKHAQAFGDSDTLVVPDFHWLVSHRFSELEGKRISNAKLKGQRIDVAQQDIMFRLDKSGAELKSETKMFAAGMPTDFFLNQPFLVYMKKRDAEMPFFVMWVDNAELMGTWSGNKTDGNQ